MGAVVSTRAGRLEGAYERGLLVFRGIPYASPPAGPLRFRPPQPVAPWTGVRTALRFGAAAPQDGPVSRLVRVMIGAGHAKQSEDCLYLNVWTPAADGGRRPVMVWIHGGAFIMGSGSTALYSGTRLARRGNAVVVTINYRLGALGFLNLGALRDGDAPSNLGIRDQIAALEWVRENIEALGGDPENVTVFGESAGAMSVGTLLGTPRAQGLFRRAILQSGAVRNVSTREQARRVAEYFLAELGLEVRDLEALRRAPIARILAAQRATTVGLGLPLGVLPWQPSVDADLLPGHPRDAIAKGLSKSVPVLVGANRDEWKLFMVGDPKGRALDEAGLRRRMQRALPGAAPDGTPLADLAFETYRGLHASPAECWVAFQTDRVFHDPAQRLATLQSSHTRETYAYLFAWSPPLMGRMLGACHGLEIPFVFGTINAPWLRPWLGMAGTARALAQRMQDAWLRFGRTGNPGHRGLPDWPVYTPERRSTMILGPRCRVDEAAFERARGFWERLG